MCRRSNLPECAQTVTQDRFMVSSATAGSPASAATPVIPAAPAAATTPAAPYAASAASVQDAGQTAIAPTNIRSLDLTPP